MMVFEIICFVLVIYGVLYIFSVLLEKLAILFFRLRHCKKCPLYDEVLKGCEGRKNGLSCVESLKEYIIGMRAALPDDEGRSEKDEKS